MSDLPHRVRRQCWNVAASSAEEAFQWRKFLHDHGEEILLPLLAKAFDEAAGREDRLLRIGRLELQVTAESPEQLAELLPGLLQGEVTERLQRLQKADAEASCQARTPEEEPFRQLLDYLCTGSPGWEVQHLSGSQRTAQLRETCGRQFSRLLDFLRGNEVEVAFYFRLLQLLSALDLDHLLDELTAGQSPRVREAVLRIPEALLPEGAPRSRYTRLFRAAKLLAELPGLRKAGTGAAEVFGQLYQSVQDVWPAGTAGGPFPEEVDARGKKAAAQSVPGRGNPEGILDSSPERFLPGADLVKGADAMDGGAFAKEGKGCLSSTLDQGLSHPVGAQREPASTPIPITNKLGSGPALAGAPEDAAAGRGNRSPGRRSELELTARGSALSVQQKPGMVTVAGSASITETGTAPGKSLPREPETSRSIRSGRCPKGGFEPMSESGEESGLIPGKPSGCNAGQQTATGTEQSARSARLQEERLRYPQLVHHGGLVLLHPFLRLYLERCGVVDAEARFTSPEALARGGALLHFLATGSEEVNEHDLRLEKILLGLSPETPLPVCRGLLEESDRQHAEALLKSAVTHWSILKDTSADGFRCSFLQRPSLLSAEEDWWRLQVERKGYDMLLDQLPWSIAVVRLPWMKKPVCTQW